MNGANSGQAASRRRVSVPVREVGLLAGHALALLVVFAQQTVCAQSSVQPTIRVAPAVSADATSQVAFAIAVGPAEAVPPLSFIRLRGLPPMATLSDAYSIAPGVWAVALAALPSLKIIVPAGVSGRSQIVITLVALDGSVLAEAKSELAVVPRQEESPARASVPAPAASMLRVGPPIEASPSAVEAREPRYDLIARRAW